MADAFNEGWEFVGQECDVCSKKHYKNTEMCLECEQTEQKLRSSGAYRQPSKQSLGRVINRLIWEERDRRGRTLRPFGTGNSQPAYEIQCSMCGNKKTTRAKYHSTRCCGERMQRV